MTLIGRIIDTTYLENNAVLVVTLLKYAKINHTYYDFTSEAVTSAIRLIG